MASGQPSSNETFSRSTVSGFPKPARWAGVTLVTTPTVGSTMPRSRAISPGSLAPHSTTSASAASGASRMVSGTPTRLFRFSRVACVCQRVPRVTASIALVAVFPLLPVTAATGPASSRRRARARSPSATKVFGTSNRTNPETGWVGRRTTAPRAPACTAWSRKRWPSKRSPSRATNNSPGRTLRVSVETPVKAVSGGSAVPRTPATRPPVQWVTGGPAQQAGRGRSPPRRTAIAGPR
jgi:hypothetical protein